MYKAGDIVTYSTVCIRYKNGSVKNSEIKTGVIEEAFHSLDRRACYWIAGENELIFHSQILNNQ